MAGWTKYAARALRSLADILNAEALPAPPKISKLMQDDELSALAGDYALSLLDENLHGFLVVKLLDVDGELRLAVEHVMPSVAWPKVRAFLGELQATL